MSESLRVTSDMDGVLAHSQPAILETFNHRLGASLTYADWTRFDLITTEAVRMSGESVLSVVGWLYSAEVMANSSIVPGTDAALRELAIMGVVPEIVTSRPTSQATVTREWVESRLPYIRVVHLREGEYVTMRGDEFKIHMVGRLDTDVYLEDDSSVVDALCALMVSGGLPHLKLVALVDRPWNDTYPTPPGVRRVGNWKAGDYGWEEIIGLIRKLNG